MLTEFEGIVPALAEALAKRSYSTLTPVQRDVLAPELKDADLLVSAQTGSGKTVAFGMSLAPTLLGDADRFARADAPLALAVAPTRELALQVRRELEWLYEMTGASFATCVGGMDMRAERQVLDRGVHIVVGTPGRLRDHIERGSLDMSALRAVVLDEADEMLDLGFREDLEFILDAAPAERRTLMFSATVPRTIANLAKRYQRDAVRVTTSSERKQHVDIEYRALAVAPSDRENAIINVLRYYEAPSAIVFCSTRAAVNRMTSRFTNRGFSVVALSGELSQSERTHALQAMRDGRARVCIATDVAARGLDLPNLELVIHADIPENSQALLHRSGRTGRAGRKGVSVLIVPHNQRKRFERLLQGAHVEANWGRAPSAEEITERDDLRLLDDPLLTEPLAEGERPFVAELLARHSAEQIAAAFVRRCRAGQSAPEDLSDAGPVPGRNDRSDRPVRDDRADRDDRPVRDAKRAPRDDFSDGVWFSLSVGHRDAAEPRWLLPMLYRAGNIAKGGIGAIRVYNGETHVEIASDSVDRFVEAVGPDGIVEKGIAVTRLEGIPEAPDEKRERTPYAQKKRYGEDRPGERGERGRPGERGKPGDRGKLSAPRNARASGPEDPAREKSWTPPVDALSRDAEVRPSGEPAQKSRRDVLDAPHRKHDAKPFGKSVAKPFAKPGPKPFGKPGSKPSGKPGSKPWKKSADTPRDDGAGAPKPRKRFKAGPGKPAAGGFGPRKRKDPR